MSVNQRQTNTDEIASDDQQADNAYLSENAQIVTGEPEQSLFSSINASVEDENIPLAEFFRRPVLYSQGSFTTTDGANTFTSSIKTVMRDVLNSKLMWKERLRGYFGFRSDLKIRIQFNASPFHQGRYILFHQPTMGFDSTDPKVRMHMYSLTQVTQLPHVEFDLACDTSAELVIPYISDSAFFVVNALNSAYDSPGYWQGEVGVWGIRPYLPLATGASGTNNVDYSIWVSWVNPQFFVSAVPQSGLIDKEAMDAKIRPGVVGTALAKTSKSLKIMSEIPLLSSVAGPASWVSSVLARAANVWGWSKPHLTNTTGVMVRMAHSNAFNSDGVEVVNKAAIFADNRLDIMPDMSANKADELDISWLATKPAYITTVSWTDSTAVDAVVYSSTVSYKDYFLTHPTVNTVTTYSMTPLSFCARFFQLGRGGIQFTFKFAKTTFHSGRLLVTFVPNSFGTTQQTSGNSSSDNMAYAYKTVIDVREGNTFTVVVPYLRAEPFCPISESIGQLRVIVLDKLRRPETVSSSVSIAVEVAGAPDIAFAVEGASTARPIVVDTVYQSGNVECELYVGGVGGTKIKPVPSIFPERVCTGEAVRSLRSLLRRWQPMRNVDKNMYVASGTAISYTPPSANNITINPEAYQLAYVSATLNWPYDQDATTTANMRYVPNVIDIISEAFLCARGSYRYKFVFPFNNNVTAAGSFVAIQHRYIPDYANSVQPVVLRTSGDGLMPIYDTISSGLATYNSYGATDITKLEINGEYIVETPPYSRFFAKGLNKYYVWTKADTPPANTGKADYNALLLQAYQQSAVPGYLTSGTVPFIYKSVGEDFALHQFVSIIPSTQ